MAKREAWMGSGVLVRLSPSPVGTWLPYFIFVAMSSLMRDRQLFFGCLRCPTYCFHLLESNCIDGIDMVYFAAPHHEPGNLTGHFTSFYRARRKSSVSLPDGTGDTGDSCADRPPRMAQGRRFWLHQTVGWQPAP